MNVVKEDELTPADTESHYKADGSIHSQERDILKFYANAVIGIKSVVGVENQSDVDQFMPIRIFGYDGAEYRHQYADLKSGKIKRGYPVVTLLLYFGTEDWNYGKNLHSCLDIPERLLPFVDDYKMNFFSMKDLTKEQINMFQTDFKVIAEFFCALGNGEEYHPSSEELVCVKFTTNCKLFIIMHNKIPCFVTLNEVTKNLSKIPHFVRNDNYPLVKNEMVLNQISMILYNRSEKCKKHFSLLSSHCLLSCFTIEEFCAVF